MFVFQVATVITMIGIGTLSVVLIGTVGLACTLTSSLVENRSSWCDIFFRGYAVVVLGSWYTFTLGYSITPFLIFIFAAALATVIIRWACLVRSIRLSPLFLVLVLFELVIAYFFWLALRPEWLSVAIQGNNDIFNYANQAIVALAHQPSLANTFAGVDLVGAARRDVFGAMVWLAVPTLLSGRTPIEVTMPALVSACAMFGVLLFDLFCRRLRVSVIAGIVLVLFTLTNGVFLFVAFNYFLSQILGFVVFCGLIISTLNQFKSGQPSIKAIIIWSFPYYFLMLMVYPYLLLPNVVLHIVLLLTLSFGGGGDRVAKRTLVGLIAIFPVAIFVLLALLVPNRLRITISLLGSSAITRFGGSNQWPSLSMVAGMPSVYGVLNGTLAGNILVYAVLMVSGLLIGWVFLRDRGRAYAAKSSLAVLALYLVGLTLYACVTAWYGSSYQQWKFASYYPLMFNAVLPAAVLVLLRRTSREIFRGGLLTICGVVVLVNLGLANQRSWGGLSAGYRSLQAVDQLKNVDTVLIDALPFGEVMLVRQYITSKVLRSSSPSYYPYWPIARDEVGPSTPVLTRSRCVASIPGTVILNGGFFLAPALPSLAVGEVFRFGAPDCRWKVRLVGVSGSEGNGRWAYGDRARLLLTMGPLPSDALSLRLRVRPFLVPGVLSEQTVEVLIDGKLVDIRRFTSPDVVDWSIPLPVGVVRNGRLTIDLLFPDSRAVSVVAPPSTDSRRLGLFLEELQVRD